MSWHVHSSASIYDSDAYGVDTDSPASAYEIIDDSLKLKDEIAISDKIIEFIKDTADEYFNTSEWSDEMWDAWRDKFTELM
jgi:hypothetical protein